MVARRLLACPNPSLLVFGHGVKHPWHCGRRAQDDETRVRPSVCLVIRSALRYLRLAAERKTTAIADRAAHVLSWPIWFTAILYGIPTWIACYFLSGGRVDPNLGALVAVLTVQTSLDSGASNYVARVGLAALKKAMDLIQQSLDNSQKTLHSVEDIAVDIRGELDHSRERDEAARIRDEQASMRDSVLIGLVRELIALIRELLFRLGERE